jgi:hypothetical protein
MDQSIDAPLIRREVTADRGGPLVSTNDVLDCIKAFVEDRFTTREVAEALRAKHPGVGAPRLEYSARCAVGWLVARGYVQRTTETVRRLTRAGEPYPATVYLRIERGADCDVALLNQIFMRA